MKKRYKLGVIGCGFMGTALIKGIVLSDFMSARKILVSDTDAQKLEEINSSLGVETTVENRKVAEECEYLLFAIKPQMFDSVASEIRGIKVEKVISIMAGMTKSYIKNALGVGLIKVARCMPNLPCSIGSGAMGVDMSDYNKSLDDTQFITMLFDCLGTVISLPEDKIDAVTGISGSGPAYVFMFIDSLIEAGIKQGLSKDEAATLAVQTVLGSAEMVLNSDKSIPELVGSVCSKGGTTIEAVKVLEDNNLRGVVDLAVDACVRRSKELSK